jgi:DNA polymerase alpha subunit B
MKTSPDILITPSKLAPLARNVLGTLVVNPGTLTKGSNGGTYAELAIHPAPVDAIQNAINAGSTSVSFPVHERTAVAVKKI